MGDDTGIVNAKLPSRFNYVREGTSVHLRNVYSNLKDGHIVVELGKGSRIEPVDARFPKINLTKHVSHQKWVSDSD